MIIRCPGCDRVTEIEHVERGRNIECVCDAHFILDDSSIVEEYSQIDATPPENIGPYKIERLIGTGGMGKVFKGLHPTLQIPVAVKTLLNEYASNREFKERFIKSAKICAKMNHSNIVRVYDFGTDNKTLYLVLEYIGGGTCLDMLHADGPLPPEKVAGIAVAVCNGLIEAEKYGIVHRDIKPDNIMRSSDGEFKLSDLGFAKRNTKGKHGSRDQLQTLEFITLGTLQYMSPEQVIDSKNCDIRADIYSLGATMYQLASGKYPFESSDSEELRRMQLEDTASPPSKHNSKIPEELDYIILKCMEKDKTERYQTPLELKNDLLAFLNHETLPSTIEIEDPVSEKARRNQTIARGFLIALVIALTLFALYVNLKRSNHPGISSSAQKPPPATPAEAVPRPRQPQTSSVSSRQESPLSESAAKERRREYWKIAEEAGIKAIENSDNFDSAIRNFEAFLDNTEYSASAQEFISRLKNAREAAVFALMTKLEREAQSLLNEGSFIKAALVYESQPPKLSAETYALRTEKAEEYRTLAKWQLEKHNEEQLMMEIARLVCNYHFKEALELYQKGEGILYDPDLHYTLESLSALPVLYAEKMKANIGKTVWIDLESGGMQPLDITNIEPPVIFAEYSVIKDGETYTSQVNFTLSSLKSAELPKEVGDFADKEVRSIWYGIKKFQSDDFASAEFSFKQTGEFSEYLQKFNEEARVERNRLFYKQELLQILQKNGADITSLPEPDELPKLDFFKNLSSENKKTLTAQLERFQQRHRSLKTDSPYDEKLSEIIKLLNAKTTLTLPWSLK